MGFLGFGKKDNFVDLTEKYKKQQEKIKNIRDESTENSTQNNSEQSPLPAPGIFGMFGGNASINNETNSSEDNGEKKRKLAKRLMDMTDKIEDLSNQIFHLQQRIEILEKKNSNY